jgi:hypothetical protein
VQHKLDKREIDLLQAKLKESLEQKKEIEEKYRTLKQEVESISDYLISSAELGNSELKTYKRSSST